MLKLVQKNKERLVLTCRTSCDLFDVITEQCSIKKGIQIDDPFTLNCCNHFIRKTSIEFDPEMIMDIQVQTERDINCEIIGSKKINNAEFKYPLQPDYPSNRTDADWYVSPCETFGCYIINHFKRKYIVVPCSLEVEMGWDKRVYKSPFPLHNHESPISIASKIAWYVDEEGFGQYVLLINGNISTLSSRKPSGWKKT
jgi:hypothetical protein